MGSRKTKYSIIQTKINLKIYCRYSTIYVKYVSRTCFLITLFRILVLLGFELSRFYTVFEYYIILYEYKIRYCKHIVLIIIIYRSLGKFSWNSWYTEIILCIKIILCYYILLTLNEWILWLMLESYIIIWS